jgi:hypothetical protein
MIDVSKGGEFPLGAIDLAAGEVSTCVASRRPAAERFQRSAMSKKQPRVAA